MGAKKHGGGAGAAAADIKRVESLQAIVLADAFARKLRPATFDGPKALLPLANSPLLEYVLEFLAAGSVEEAFVFCCHGGDELEAYVAQVAPRFAPMQVSVLRSRAACFSPGDALREVYEANVIQGTFVLCGGDVVTNMSLAALLRAHADNKAKDKDAVLTATVLPLPLGHRGRPAREDAAWTCDADTGRLLHFEALPEGLCPEDGSPWEAPDTDRPPRVAIPLEGVLAGAGAASVATVRCDLLDCCVDVCDHEVLTLLVDNFDWADLRRDLVAGIIGSDILGKTVYLHEAAAAPAAGPCAFAARAHDWRGYGELTGDVLSRWAFPLVPDSGLLGTMDWQRGDKRAAYRVGRGAVYREEEVDVARTSTVGPRAMLGAGTSVDQRASVVRSVVGRRCHIGAGATVLDAVLWSGVHVGAGATVRGAVLCDDVRVGAGATVLPGAVLGRSVVVAEGATVPGQSLYTTHAARVRGAGAKADDEDEDDRDDRWAETEDGDGDDVFGDDDGDAAAEPPTPCADLGDGGAGFLLARTAPAVSFACARRPGAQPEESCFSEDGGSEAGDKSPEEVFKENAADLLTGMLADGAQTDNIVLEVNALKFAYNRSVAACAAVCVRAILSRAMSQARAAGAGSSPPARKTLLLQLRKAIVRWGPLLQRYVTSTADQVHLIEALEECGQSMPWVVTSFSFVLQFLYEADVLLEEPVMRWAKTAGAAKEGTLRRDCYAHAGKFIEWLQTAESEEDESEGEDDEED